MDTLSASWTKNSLARTFPMLPESVHTKLRSAAIACAETALDENLKGHVGPKSPQDKLTDYGLKTEFGNCFVEIKVTLK